MRSDLSTSRGRLLDVYQRLEAALDIDRWHWREDTGWLEVCVGAVLVQHTAWANVERALARLRDGGALSLSAIVAPQETELADLVRPAGMPLQKAQRLKQFAALVERRGGPERLLSLPVEELRAALLSTHGIGPETADVILLHAARRLAFAIDAYARRLFRRLGLGPEGDGYYTWQRWFEERLPREVGLYRRFRAGIVLHCKETCRSRPRCPGCCLLDVCPTGQSTVA